MLKAARMLTLKHFFIAIVRASSTLLEPATIKESIHRFNSIRVFIVIKMYQGRRIPRALNIGKALQRVTWQDSSNGSQKIGSIRLRYGPTQKAIEYRLQRRSAVQLFQ